MKKYKIFLFVWAIIWIALDQITKQWAEQSFQYAVANPVIPFLNWTLVYNKGAAFSFLADFPGWQRWFFSVVSGLATIGLSVWICKLKGHQKFTGLGLAFILSGAVGNLIDRSLYGHVIDFIDVYYQNWHWPVFNVADIAVCIGVFMLLINNFFEKEAE